MYQFVKNNQEKANVFNTVLAVLAIVFTSRELFADGTVMDKISASVFILGLLSGLLYIASGYKKNANVYYKGFMIVYALQSVYCVVTKLCRNLPGGMDVLRIITTVCLIIAAICVVILAFNKNLGVSKSLALAAVNFFAIIVRVAIVIFFMEGTIVLPGFWFTKIITAALAYEFVIGKYVDKEARGTK